MKSSRQPSRESAQRYVDILSDAGFKAVFGDRRNKDVLVDLLNVVLPPHRRVRDLSYMTTELPQFSPLSKGVRLDLRCSAHDGTVFIVEVQCYRQANFFRRCVLYAAKSYDAGAEKADGQRYDIPPVYLVCLLSGTFQDFQAECAGKRARSASPDSFLSEYTFREKTTLAVPDETINLLFLELNRFDRDLDRCVSDLDRWCYALKHVGTLDALPGELRLEAFRRLFDACEIARFEPQVKLTYEKEMITERDYYNIIETAKDDGREQGREEGLEQGRAEGLQAGIEQGSREAAATGRNRTGQPRGGRENRPEAACIRHAAGAGLRADRAHGRTGRKTSLTGSDSCRDSRRAACRSGTIGPAPAPCGPAAVTAPSRRRDRVSRWLSSPDGPCCTRA